MSKSILRRILLLAGICLHSSLALADVKADLARLESIQMLAEQDNQAALKQLRSMRERFDTQTDYELRMETLRQLSYGLFDAGELSEAQAVRAEIIQLATQHKDKEVLALMKIEDAYRLRDAGKMDRALAKLDEIAGELKGSSHPENLLRLETAYASIFHAASRFEQALAHHLEAIRLTDQLPRMKVFFKTKRMDSLASLYYTMHNPEQALNVTNEALSLATQISSPRIVAGLRQTQALALGELKRYPEALVSYERALKAAEEANLPKLEALILSNMADLYLRTENWVKAETVAKLALKKAEEVKDEPAVMNAKANVGLALGGQGKMAAAMEYLAPALAYSRNGGDKGDIADFVGEIGRMFERAKMYKEALEYTREQQKLNDELFRADRAKAVATLQEQFDAEQRKKQIEILARENEVKDAQVRNSRLQQMVAILGAIVTVMIGVFIYMLYRKVKQTNLKLEEMNQQLEFHSTRDPLTGLHNRRSFLELMKFRIDKPAQDRRADDDDSPDCLMILDIDHFKHINDTWGHAAGDSVLVEVAKRLRAAVRDTDMALRWGGEEFLIFSPKTRASQLTPMVERILRAIGGSPFQITGHKIPVTVSAGYISLPFGDVPENDCNWEKAMQFADMALYLGKVNGRNRAYGLIDLLVPFEQAIPLMDTDFSEAIKQGMVEVVVINGPSSSS